MAEATADLLKFLRRLRAVRTYTPEPISQQTVEDILEVGRWSGSGSNRQPCEVVVIRDPAVQEKMRDWGANTAASAAVVLLIVTKNEGSLFDEGRMAERLLLAAAAHGLGSTVAFLKGDGPAAAKQLLGIPAEHRAIAVVTIGRTDIAAHQARPANPTPRKPMSEYVHWDRF